MPASPLEFSIAPAAVAHSPQKTHFLKVEIPALSALIVVAAALRFWHLGVRSFWIDEGASIAIARLDAWNFLRILWRREANMSLYYLLLRGWTLLGTSEFTVRSLSVLFGVASVPAIYFLGKQLWDRKTGVLAALLLTVNAYHIRYSQEARSYSLVVLLVILSFFFFAKLIEQNSKRNSLGYILCTALAVYAHFYAALILPAQWLTWLLIKKKRAAGLKFDENPFQRALQRILILLLPVLFFIAATGAGPIAWLQHPTLHDIHIFALSMTGSTGDWLLGIYIFCFLLAVTAALRSFRSSEFRTARLAYILVFSWLLLPPFIVFGFSFLKPLYIARFLIICLPATSLLAAAGIASLRKPWLIVPLAAVIVALAISSVQTFYKTGMDQVLEDWRAATQYVLQHGNAGDGILFYSAQGRMPFEIYKANLKGAGAEPAIVFPAHTERLSYQDFIGRPGIELIEGLPAHYQRVWVILCHATNEDRSTQLIQNTLKKRYGNPAEVTFTGINILLYSQHSVSTATHIDPIR